MCRVRTIHNILLAAICFSVFLAGCSSDTLDETPAVETAEAVPTVPFEDERPESEAGDQDESEASPSGLTAVIASGDSAGAGKPFTFDATQSEAGERDIVHYQWNMGDGVTLFGISVEHAYSEPGFYTVTLTIVAENGDSDIVAKVIEVVELAEEPPLSTGDEFTLAGSNWLMNKAVRGTTVSLEFGEETLSGFAGCNSYEAGYTAEASTGVPASISVATIGSSSTVCTAEVMAQEQGYLESLASATHIILDVPTLTLETGAGTLTFTLDETTK